MMPKMVKMGVKRKDMHEPAPTSPASEKDWENEMVEPEMHVSGVHAEKMGAADLKTGDRVRQTVVWRVKDHTMRQENGKKAEYSMTLCMERGSDHEEAEGDEKPEGEKHAKGESPAMRYIQQRAAE